MVAVACSFWYRYDTATYRREAAKTAKLIRQWESTQKVDTDSEVELTSDVVTSVERNVPTPEKRVETPSVENVLPEPVSPYGFGPYPEIPPDFPENYMPPWTWSESERQVLLKLSGDPVVFLGGELTFRVYIKMWNEGIRELPGIAVDPDTHLMSLTRTNTAYVTYDYRDGTQERYLSHVKRTGKATELSNEDILTGNIPEDVQIVPFDEMETLDPYTYLGLKR